MEQKLKEYFVELYNKFQQPGNNPKIKKEHEPQCYDIEFDPNNFLSLFQKKPKIKFEPEDYAFSINFYRLYKQVIDDEPWMLDFLSILPKSYHRIIVNNCGEAFDALTVIVKTIENDWSKTELANYFSVSRN